MPYYKTIWSNRKMTKKVNGLAVKSKVKGGMLACHNHIQTLSTRVNGLAVKSKVKGGSLTANYNQTLSR